MRQGKDEKLIKRRRRCVPINSFQNSKSFFFLAQNFPFFFQRKKSRGSKSGKFSGFMLFTRSLTLGVESISLQFFLYCPSTFGSKGRFLSMTGEQSNGEGTSAAQAAVLQPSEQLDSTFPIIKGPNLEEEQTLNSLLSSFSTIGFQASGVSKACEIIEKMRKWRLSDELIKEDGDEDLQDDTVRKEIGATIFLGFTSNLISSGLREIIVFLVKHRYVSAIVTTAGGIEEDLIKCLGTTHLGDFHLDGAHLRKRGLNRIGNLLVPNDNYCKFEDWVMPRLEKMRQEQGDDVSNAWSPSRVCERLGHEINDESSFLYWAAKVKFDDDDLLLLSCSFYWLTE